MSDRSLKGTGFGAKSFENEAGIDFAPRQEVGFFCPSDHLFTMVFAQEAELPTQWTCPRCGTDALRTDGRRPDVTEDKPARTHWDMLRERRSVADLERLLAERLAILHADRKSQAMAGLETPQPRKPAARRSSAQRVSQSSKPKSSTAGSAA